MQPESHQASITSGTRRIVAAALGQRSVDLVDVRAGAGPPATSPPQLAQLGERPDALDVRLLAQRQIGSGVPQ